MNYSYKAILVFIALLLSLLISFLFIPIYFGSNDADEQWNYYVKNNPKVNIYEELSGKGYLTNEDISKIKDYSEERISQDSEIRDEIYTNSIDKYRALSWLYFSIISILLYIFYTKVISRK